MQASEDANSDRATTATAARNDRLPMLDAPESPAAEAYRELRTNLRFDARLDMAGGGRAIVIADADGTTDRAAAVANLGIAFARAGDRVVVVDADLRGAASGGLSALLGSDRATAGLGISIEGPEEDHKRVLPLVETAVPRLLLLPAGARGANPADLLGAEAFGVLLAALRAQADIVLFDAPPVTEVADSRAIAARVDGVLLLIAENRTRRPQAQRAIAALEQVGAKILGVVLLEK